MMKSLGADKFVGFGVNVTMNRAAPLGTALGVYFIP
jgi:hypothetical protein